MSDWGSLLACCANCQSETVLCRQPINALPQSHLTKSNFPSCRPSIGWAFGWLLCTARRAVDIQSSSLLLVSCRDGGPGWQAWQAAPLTKMGHWPLELG